MPSRIEIALILFAPLVAVLLTASCVLCRLFRARRVQTYSSFFDVIGSKK